MLITILFLLGADEPKQETRALADFKLVISLYGVRKPPIATAELVVRNAVAYQFLTDSPNEVMIVDPGQSRLILFDLTRKIQTEFTSERLDAHLGKLHKQIGDAAGRLEKSEARADKVSAAMSRNLIDPHFEIVSAPAKNSVRLINPTVEVDATGEPESNESRLAMITNCLAAIAKVSAIRDPENLPPFTKLAVLRVLAVERKLRPTEISYLYRLSGTPKRLRFTYRLETVVNDRDREALARVDRLRAPAKFVPYERYEKGDTD